MTGTRFTIDYDDAPVRALLTDMIAAGDDLTPLLDIIGSYMETVVDERFETESGPGGNPWPPSIRALVEGGTTLTDSARLRQSYTRQVTPRSVAVGTNVPYAGGHQDGVTITPTDADALVFRLPGSLGWRRVQSVTLPARPMVGFDDEMEAEIGAIVADYLRDVADRGGAP